MVFSESSGIMNSVRLKNAVKPLKTELKLGALFCNVTTSIWISYYSLFTVVCMYYQEAKSSARNQS